MTYTNQLYKLFYIRWSTGLATSECFLSSLINQCAKIVCGACTRLRENLAESDQPPPKMLIYNQYLFVARQP